MRLRSTVRLLTIAFFLQGCNIEQPAKKPDRRSMETPLAIRRKPQGGHEGYSVENSDKAAIVSGTNRGYQASAVGGVNSQKPQARVVGVDNHIESPDAEPQLYTRYDAVEWPSEYENLFSLLRSIRWETSKVVIKHANMNKSLMDDLSPPDGSTAYTQTKILGCDGYEGKRFVYLPRSTYYYFLEVILYRETPKTGICDMESVTWGDKTKLGYKVSKHERKTEIAEKFAQNVGETVVPGGTIHAIRVGRFNKRSILRNKYFPILTFKAE